MKRVLHRDTRALLLGLAGIILIGLGVGLWGYFTGAFEISASIGSGKLIAEANKAGTVGTGISGVLVRWGRAEPKIDCTTGADGHCTLPGTYRIGSYRAEFTKNGYAPDPAVVSQYCFSTKDTCTLTAWLSPAKAIVGTLKKESGTMLCGQVLPPPGSSSQVQGCQVSINFSPGGQKTWRNVARRVGSQTEVNVARYLSPGKYQITSGTVNDSDGTTWTLKKVGVHDLAAGPFEFTIGSSANVYTTYVFSQ